MGSSPCPLCLLPVQPSCWPGSCLRLIEVPGWMQGEALGKCLPRAKHHLECQCRWHWPPAPPGNSHRMLLAGQGEPHHRPHHLNPAPDNTHTMLPSLLNQQQEELAAIHLSLPTFPLPCHSLTQGRWGFGLTPPRSHPLQPCQWNTGKYRSTQNTALKPRKYYSIPQIHLSYCLRCSLLPGCCGIVKFMGNRLIPSIPKRQRTINTSLFLILLPSALGLFYSTFLLYPPVTEIVEYNQHLSVFFQTASKGAESLPRMDTGCPQLQPRAPMFSSTSRDLLQLLKWNLLGYAWKCISLC